MSLVTVTRMPLPTPRGELSARLARILRGAELPGDLEHWALSAAANGVLDDDDAQLSLVMLYELHYRGLDAVPDTWEWDPDLLAARAVLENRFEQELRALTAAVTAAVDPSVEMGDLLFALTAPSRGPSLSRFMAARATDAQFREFLTHRSVYQLKEADPHTWAVPRLGGAVKAALVEVQLDEYGNGRTEYMHQSLFAATLRAIGLDDGYGALVDRVPAVVLSTVNAMSLFGLHRRLLGALVGHLAAFEMTSSLPNKLYGNGLRRLGYGPESTAFFDVHVTADAVHEQIAGRDLAGGLAIEQPELADDIVFGAAACLALDDRAAAFGLGCWEQDRSALRPPA